MKRRKYSSRAAVRLLVLAAIVLTFKAQSTVAHAGLLPIQLAMIPAATAPIDALVGQASMTAPEQSVDLPPIEEFILTPPNPVGGAYKTTLSLRFAERSAERLSPMIPMALGSQNVTLQRSADEPGLYSAAVDFNWEALRARTAATAEVSRQWNAGPGISRAPSSRHGADAIRRSGKDPASAANPMSRLNSRPGSCWPTPAT